MKSALFFFFSSVLSAQIVKSIFLVLLACAVVSPHTSPVEARNTDEDGAALRLLAPDECERLAERGACGIDDDGDGDGDRLQFEDTITLMRRHCPEACHRRFRRTRRFRRYGGTSVTSFFDLNATDIEGRILRMEQFRRGNHNDDEKPRVLMITNVASECGLTESHYEGMKHLHRAYRPRLEILAFPCNAFGAQEPGTPEDIQHFAISIGVNFRIMDKINAVNGPFTHPVYRFLKQETGTLSIPWNFGAYFLVSTSTGTVTAHRGVSPLDLESKIQSLLDEKE